MIIWGGAANPAMVNDGYRYDPRIDKWKPISTSQAPAPRASHCAVWTGEEMIVWGGTAGTNELGDGAAYNPATDSWRPLPASGAPLARQSATALWTGTEMIIWGGFRFGDLGQIPFADGARYDPKKNTWLPINSRNAPSPTFGYSAVWTGREMLLWGGASQQWPFTVLNDGFRYDPVSDQWQIITSLFAPEGRAYHSAVWSGTGMIIAGGSGEENVDRRDTAIYYARPPELQISPDASSTAVIRWAFPSTGFQLEELQDLGSTTWSPPGKEQAHRGNDWEVQAGTVKAQFFRLKSGPATVSPHF